MNLNLIGNNIELDGVVVATLAPGVRLNYGALDILRNNLDGSQAVLDLEVKHREAWEDADDEAQEAREERDEAERERDEAERELDQLHKKLRAFLTELGQTRTATYAMVRDHFQDDELTLAFLGNGERSND
jgi:uncharacterized protein (DUF3084 family)